MSSTSDGEGTHQMVPDIAIMLQGKILLSVKHTCPLNFLYSYNYQADSSTVYVGMAQCSIFFLFLYITL